MTTYWHGGTPGLGIGDLVLPPDRTGAPTVADFGADGVCRRDRIYISNHPAVAVLYASMHPSGRGRVYEVLPAGPLEPDPDWSGEPGLSLETTEARVFAVHDPGDLLVDGTVAQLRAKLISDNYRPA
jgi:hypothetical protein